MDLTDRKKQILKVVVEDYIRTAEPVGSKAIAAEMGGSVSSATIRNELSDLVELGYLEQPHTSAGRVPSPKGYRLYVNELMERQRLSLAETEKINQSLQMKMEELDRVISQAGRAVSSFVNYPAYVATAGKGSITASRFDLLPVDEKSCIVVMMMGDNRVKSQLLRMQLKVDRDQMAALVELLNRHFTGISIKEMNQKLMAISQGITPQLFLLLSQTVNYAVDVLEESNHREFIMAGTNQLLKQGCAIAYPVLKKFHDCGAEVHAVVGFKSKDVVILEDKFKAVSSVLKVCTDDGSYGQKGLVTQALQELLDAGNQYDEIFAIGPMVMMKFVCKTTAPYGVPTTVSMSPIMIDGTGMCGGCRLTVGGETKFACVDGPDFDGQQVDWDLAVKRNQMYHDFEVRKHEEVCNLFKQEVK